LEQVNQLTAQFLLKTTVVALIGRQEREGVWGYNMADVITEKDAVGKKAIFHPLPLPLAPTKVWHFQNFASTARR
jgi:hypothetical protein